MGVGAYCAARWLGALLAFALRALARNLWPDDYVVHSFVQWLVTSAPDAFGAAL